MEDEVFNRFLEIEVTPTDEKVGVHVSMGANYSQAKELVAAVMLCLVEETAKRGKVSFTDAFFEIAEMTLNAKHNLEKEKKAVGFTDNLGNQCVAGINQDYL